MPRLLIYLVAITYVGILTGCQKHQSAKADIKYSVFEAPKNLVEKIVKIDEVNETYKLTHISKGDIDKLRDYMLESPGLLAEQTRNVSFWPRLADTWTYSRADQNSLGAGGGGGFLGTRVQDGQQEIRIEYDVLHTINTLEPVQSKIFYEGAVPDNGAIIALIPYRSKDGKEIVLVITFEAENWITN